MKRRHLALVPLALLAAGCAAPPHAYWEKDVPPLVHKALPAPEDALAAWQLPPSNPWSGFNKLTLLSALPKAPREVALPDVRRLRGLSRAECAASRLAEAGLPPGTLWIVDLRGAESVAFGAALSQLAREPVSLVLTFNNRPARNGLVPAEETLAELVSVKPRLPSGRGPSTPVFLLDRWRLAYRDVKPNPDLIDNRYVLTPADFPDAGLLRGHGISRVAYLTDRRADASGEEDDLSQTLLEYERAGIQATLVDLDWLCGLQDRQLWDVALRSLGGRLTVTDS